MLLAALIYIYFGFFCLVLPAQPHDIKAEDITNSSIRLSWHMGFGGIYPISLCSVQVPSKAFFQ